MKKFETFEIVRAKRKDVGSNKWPYVIRDNDDREIIAHIKSNYKGQYSLIVVSNCFYFTAQDHRDIASFMEAL